MSKSVEDNFKVCGLCSQLVDESVEVSAGLRVFLIGFLGIDNVDLPTKVCLECYTHTVECKRFKDRCDKTLLKLQRSELYSSMILGRSPKDLASLKDMPLPIPPNASTTKFVEKNAADQVLEEAPPPRNSPPKSGPKSKSGRPGPASKIGNKAAGPATNKRSNELKGILDAQAPPEVRKLRSEIDAKPSRRSESISSAASAVLDVPRSRRSLPTQNEKPVPPPKKEALATPASKKKLAGKKEEPVTPTARQTRGGHGSTPAAATASSTSSAKAGRRSTGGVSSRAHGLQPEVGIRRVERQRADREYERSGVQRSKLPLPNALPARGAKKRVAPQPEPEDEQPLQKRGRKSEKVVVPPETPKPTEELKSSFGRKRTPRTDKGYIYTDVVTGNDIASPEEEKPLKKKKPGPASKKETPKAASKPVPKGRKSTVREELVFVEPTPQVNVEEESEDDDDEEMFPSIGPYQCEICQNITDTKQEFVDHIKDNHRDIVDEEVLNSLERDLQKSRKKAAKEQRLAGKKGHPSPAKSAKSPPSSAKDKKGPASKKGQAASVEKAKPKPGSKSAAATSAKGKATPAKGGPASARKRASLGNEETPTSTPVSQKKNEIACEICGAMTKTQPSEIARHLKSRGCRAAAEKKLAGGESAEAEIDPLDVDTSGANGNNDSLNQTIDDIVSRTCQYCGKVVDDIKDLPGHYTTKGCVAKKYQMQNGVGNKSSATPVVIENAEDDDVDMGSVESEEQIVPNDIESDTRAEKHQNIGTSGDTAWSYASGPVAQNGLSYGGHEAQPAFVDAMAYANNQSASVIVQSVVPDGFSPL